MAEVRSGKTESTGTAGQNYVMAQFEELEWGPSVTAYHDLGTDLWLQLRDSRRFDLKTLAGAQVKSGPSWFEYEEKDKDDEVIGWWFYEADDSHFDYWADHSIAHFLILHRMSDHESFWVHVERSKIRSTGKGNKILVRADSTLDSDHIEELTRIATANRASDQWEGSIWQAKRNLSADDQLRAALIVPRIIAPHPNDTVESLQPVEAIALLIQQRRHELHEYVDMDKAAIQKDWRWKFFLALESWLTTGDTSSLADVADIASSAEQRVATILASALAEFEQGRVTAAVSLVSHELNRDSAAPVDQALLHAHHARYLVELNQTEEARRAAIEASTVQNTHPDNPVAQAAVASASYVLFSTSPWEAADVAQLIQNSDTVSAWWRSQVLATGLGRYFEEAFRTWSHDTTVTFGAEDVTSTKLRSAVLLAGMAADGAAWKYAASLLARRELMKPRDIEAQSAALDLLRLSADHKSLKLAIAELLRRGELNAVVGAGSRLKLDETTRSTLKPSIQFLQSAGDVLSVDDASRHASWILSTLEDPTQAQNLNMHSILDVELLKALKSLVFSVSDDRLQAIIHHIATRPTLEDQSKARAYANLVYAIPADFWNPEDLQAIECRDRSDNFELREALDRLLADRSTDFREGLRVRILEGELSALASFGNVSDLSSDEALHAIQSSEKLLAREIEEAKSGSFAVRPHDPLRILTLLNLWFPEVSRWSRVEEYFNLPLANPNKLADSIRLFSLCHERVPEKVKTTIRASLERFAKSEPDRLLVRVFDNTDIRGISTVALMHLFPDTENEYVLFNLLRGSDSQRAAAADLIALLGDDSKTSVLVTLAADSSFEVARAAASALARVAAQNPENLSVVELVKKILSQSSVELAEFVSRALHDPTLSTEAIGFLSGLLAEHPSARVRHRARRAGASAEEGSS